jgi:hypothetical protein
MSLTETIKSLFTGVTKPTEWTKESTRKYLLDWRNSRVTAAAEWVIPGQVDTIILNMLATIVQVDSVWDAVWKLVSDGKNAVAANAPLDVEGQLLNEIAIAVTEIQKAAQ